MMHAETSTNTDAAELQPPKQPDPPQFLELPWLDEDGKSQFGVDAAMILLHDWLAPRLANRNKLRRRNLALARV